MDIGEKLGTGAYCENLRRTKIADYSIDAAKTLADFGITSYCKKREAWYNYRAMISKENKAKAIALTQVNKNDVGSPQAQVSF